MLCLFSEYKLLVLGTHSSWTSHPNGTLHWWYLLPDSETQGTQGQESICPPREGFSPAGSQVALGPCRDTHPLCHKEATPLVSSPELQSHSKVCTLKAPLSPQGSSFLYQHLTHQISLRSILQVAGSCLSSPELFFQGLNITVPFNHWSWS